ncbi:hypothetical protein O0L34_g4852 [Tuta absoluta]|nr:hypothetical protein O0L34_g4852 [Tuta absoluta]
MRWRPHTSSRSKERANISFFIFIIFFAVFGIIILTELLFLERTSQPVRSHFEDLQHAAVKTERASEEIEPAPPAQTPLDGVWQPVGGTRFRFYVYSAWVERRTVGAVRVIAATKTRGSDAVICRLWLNNNRTVTLKAKVQAIRENWNLKYSAMYVLCLLRDSGVKPQDTVGASIAVISAFAPNRPSTNLLIVKSTEPEEGIQDKLYICVKPFHFLYNRDQWLIEWIELNRLLGVSHFIMYNKTVSPRVGCLLTHYQRQGLVTLLPWKLPILSKVEIRTEGQFAAFNDCLYRSMSKASWLLPIDTDEVVFPRRTHTIPEMLSAFAATIKLPSKTPAAFLFRNAFFYTRWKVCCGFLSSVLFLKGSVQQLFETPFGCIMP